MNKEITIIIPTYNMEQYIGKCLDSLLIPEFDQVEVLVVNDGSKDRSSEIAHSYADRYPDSIRVIDKPNGNYGSCINAALPLAKGRYVKILDADDTFDTNAFSEMVNILPQIDDEVVITNHSIVNTKGDIVQTTSFSHICSQNKTLTIEEAISTLLLSYVQMHRIAYKKVIFLRFDYHQTEGISYTDSQWSVIPMAYCHSVRYLNLNVYQYLMGREGQTMSQSQMTKTISHFFEALKDTVRYYNNYTYSKIGKQLFLQDIMDIHQYVYFTTLRFKTPQTIKLLKSYDTSLARECVEIYNLVSNIVWTEEVPFKLFKDLRRKDYPSNYKIPILKKIHLSFKIRFKRLFSHK